MTKLVIEANEFYTVDEFATETGKGVATIWRWIASKKIITVKVGDRTLIPKSELARYWTMVD
jgi:excisionase family DNA binding protein